MQMAKGDFVILAHDSALKQPPETFNAVRVDFAVCIRELMIDDEVLHERLNGDVSAILISYKNGFRRVHVLTKEFGKPLR
jgi:hypothetical protein